MSRRWSKNAYPFSVERGADRPGAFRSSPLRSDDGWIEYQLTPSGWFVEHESQGGGLLAEGRRTVIQTARDSEATDEVLSLTEEALNADWFHGGDAEMVRQEFAIASRARCDGTL